MKPAFPRDYSRSLADAHQSAGVGRQAVRETGSAPRSGGSTVPVLFRKRSSCFVANNGEKHPEVVKL
jgi:hypothetical protein